MRSVSVLKWFNSCAMLSALTTFSPAPPDATMPQKFAKAFPHFTGPITPEESVKAVLAVVEKAEVDSEYAGGFVSHFGNKVWL